MPGDFDVVKERTDLVQLIGEHVALRRSGRSYRGDPLYRILYNAAMKTFALTEARKDLSKIVDRVSKTHDHVTITRQGRPEAVVMSADEFESWQETLEIMADPEAMASIKRGLRDIKAGRVTPYGEVRKRLRL